MHAKKICICLSMIFCLITLVACSNKENDTSKETSQSEKKAQDVAFVNDINNKNERVWLCLAQQEKFSKDAVTGNAIHIKNGKVEVIDTVVSLRELDSVDDNKLWNYLLKQNQKHFEKYKDEHLSDTQKEIDNATEFLDGMNKRGYDHFDGISKEEAEKRVSDAKKLKEKISSTKTIEPVEMQVEAKIETDSTGNHSISETLKLKPKEEGIVLLFNSSYGYAEFTNIPTGNMQILNREYMGYSGESAMFITRKSKGTGALNFDKSDEKGVKEVTSSN